jgi:hypothetical protein
MLSKVCSAAVNGIDAYPVEVEVNAGYGDTLIVMLSCILPNISTPYDLACCQLSFGRRLPPGQVLGGKDGLLTETSSISDRLCHDPQI